MPKIENIIYRYLQGTLTSSEKTLLQNWLKDEKHRKCFNKICDKETILQKSILYDKLYKEKEESWKKISAQTRIHKYQFKHISFIAASILIPLFLAGGYFLFRPLSLKQNNQDILCSKVENTELRLSDGSIINLQKDSIFSISLADGQQIKNAQGTLNYLNDTLSNVTFQYHELHVPRGSEYRIILPDSSIVWLNAESSLRFPTKFGNSTRKVYAQGELYFDIKHNNHIPFEVEVNPNYHIEVLGTKFNLRSYPNTPRTTTLLKGSVRIKNNSQSIILKPNQQAKECHDMNIEVLDVNASKFIAWHKGIFYFEHTPLKEIMEELARWYDLDIHFINTDLEKECFTIEMKRYDNFKKVLRLVENTGIVNIAIEGNKIFIR